ncbi:amino acid transporter [Asanoa ishikariensis]|uniref:Threonine/homoserine/homoserine lactone efflux protein n=1 Tax=Asanoa ishikariensis TaxID=137265 RepID=A0A1H3UHA8_9ACTN|nr:LysE family translocator [Asanoa ishikariensis]GIF63525.1 amino acid transporter [Asanoa ishikariensis]SDZ61784.1 Threonine/homoserine/homoserine lactone efflux protein [Asanoa ishikariensis]
MPTRVPVFVVTTWLLAMLPGAGQALMLRQTIEGGRRRAWASVAGTCTGLVVWTTAAAAGLSAVLLANPHAYAGVRIAGGVLLAGLGVSTLWSLRRPVAASLVAAPTTGYGRAFAAGLATNLGNPKAGVFAISLLPQFLTDEGPVFLSSVGLGVLWALVTGAWYLLFTWAVDRGRALVARPAMHWRLQVVTGCTLICIGAAVATGL